MSNARFFIRDDDVWSLDRSFRFYFDQMAERGLPVIYAVIPGKMEDGLVKFLCRAKEKTPHLLDIVQHGWMHTDRSAEAGRKYEFGETRTLEDQKKDIQNGLKVMRSAFGDCFTRAFVPPFHGYDSRTIDVLKEEGFSFFSAGASKLNMKPEMVELPARVSFSNYAGENASVHSAADMVKMLAQDISRGRISGIVTHHEDFVSDADRKEFECFFGLIQNQVSRKELQPMLFSELSGHD